MTLDTPYTPDAQRTLEPLGAPALLPIRRYAAERGWPESTFRRTFIETGLVRPIVTGPRGRRIDPREADAVVAGYCERMRAPLPLPRVAGGR